MFEGGEREDDVILRERLLREKLVHGEGVEERALEAQPVVVHSVTVVDPIHQRDTLVPGIKAIKQPFEREVHSPRSLAANHES